MTEESQLTQIDKSVLTILKKYTDNIKVTKSKLETVFELELSKDSGYLDGSRTDPFTLVQHGIDREVRGLIDPFCNSNDVDFATYSVYYTKCNILTVLYNTHEQRETIEQLRENKEV
jgi:hypothetical protein